nr:MAG TPA: hypothetical protein [Bacteriophage sp.]
MNQGIEIFHEPKKDLQDLNIELIIILFLIPKKNK